MCFCGAFIKISKCPSLAWTQGGDICATHQLRCRWRFVRSYLKTPIKTVLQFTYIIHICLVESPLQFSTNVGQPSSDLECWMSYIWNLYLKLSHTFGGFEHCLLKRYKTHQRPYSWQAVAAESGAHHGSTCHPIDFSPSINKISGGLFMKGRKPLSHVRPLQIWSQTNAQFATYLSMSQIVFTITLNDIIALKSSLQYIFRSANNK